MIASDSVGFGKSKASNLPDATNGANWKGLADERMKTNSSASPNDEVSFPDAETTAIEPRWRDSTLPPRVTSTRRRATRACDLWGQELLPVLC